MTSGSIVYTSSPKRTLSEESTTPLKEKNNIKITTANVRESVTTISAEPVRTEWNADGIKYLIGAILVEWLTWGFPCSYGILQRHYLSPGSPYHDETTYLAMVGTIAAGAPYIGGMLAIIPITRYPQYRRWMVVTGCFICAMSLLISSFSTQLWHLLLTQGVGYAVGFIFLYNPLFSMLNEWFVVKRGMAYGILSSIAGTSGLTIPYLIEYGVLKYGHAITLQAFSVLFAVILGPTMFLLNAKPSNSTSLIVEADSVFRDSDELDASIIRDTNSSQSLFQIIRTPKFAIFTWSNIFQGLFYMMPSLWIPTYALAEGLTAAEGTRLLVIMNITTVMSQFLIGWVSDHALALPVAVSTFVTAIATFSLWYISSASADANYGVLLGFVIVFGLFSGGYSVFYGRFIIELSEDQDKAMWLWSFFELERGVGIVISGPISGMIINNALEKESYKLMILLTGASMAISSLSIVGWVFVKRERKEDRLKNAGV